ncbi:MAG: DUF255 domain-containing protein [Bacteroidota bacterium]
MSKFIFLLTSVIISLGIFSFRNSHPVNESKVAPVPGQIEWLSWEEAQLKMQVEKKKLFVDIYTDWCTWCKKMDTNTFRQPHIVKYLNEHYYAIRFDAEYKEDIDFMGKTYQFTKNGNRGYHELAAEITRGRLTFPTIVFMDESQSLIQSVPGYRAPEEFEQIITYFARNEHTKTPWETYLKGYEPLPKE